MNFSIQILCTSYVVINVLGKECNISKHRYTIRIDVFLIRYCSLFSKEALHWYSLFENQYVEGKIHFIVVNKNIPLMAWGKERIVLQLYVKWTHMYVIWYEGPNEKNSECMGFSCSNWCQSPNFGRRDCFWGGIPGVVPACVFPKSSKKNCFGKQNSAK